VAVAITAPIKVAASVVAIPMVIMLAATTIAFPISRKKVLAIMMRCHPTSTSIRRTGPIAFVPLVAMADWIPIPLYPKESRARTGRHGVNPRGRRRPNSNAYKNKKRLMSLPVEEFLRRFLLHTLPQGFVRIRHFGLLANRKRAALLPLCFHLLGCISQPAIGKGAQLAV